MGVCGARVCVAVALLFAVAVSQDSLAGEAQEKIVQTVNEVVAEGCGAPVPSSAKAAFESVLNTFSQNLLADVSSSFAPGAFTPCLADTHLQSVSFGTPTYSIELPNAVVGRVDWEYQFKESTERYDDGGLVFSIQTDANQKITSFLVAHENESFDQRVPRPKPSSVGALVNEFFGGLASFNLRESLEHTSENFVIRILGDTSLFPHHLDNTITRNNFAEFKEKYGQVFDFTGKSIRCSLQSEDEDSSASHCLFVGKHARVKFCLDALVLAESKDGLLSVIDVYIAGACDPKTKFEDDEEKEEKLLRENEKLEARRIEEEKKTEKEKVDTERKAEKERADAEKRAEKARVDAERKAEKEKADAERRAQEAAKKGQKSKKNKEKKEEEQ